MLHEWKKFLVIILYLFRYQSWDAYVLVRFISQFWSKIIEKSLKIIESYNKIILSKKIIRGRIRWGGVEGGCKGGNIYSRSKVQFNCLSGSLCDSASEYNPVLKIQINSVSLTTSKDEIILMNYSIWSLG